MTFKQWYNANYADDPRQFDRTFAETVWRASRATRKRRKKVKK